MDAQTLFERGPVVVFRWKNAPGWPVEYVSVNVQDVLGYPADSFVQGLISYAAIIAEDDLERVGSEVSEATRNGVPSFDHQPYQVHHQNGQLRWLFDHTQLQRDPAGDVTHYLGYIIDITSWIEAQRENQELERRLLHAQKLESLGVLAGGVAHDFNNLLGGILGQASLIRRTLGATPEALEATSRGLEQIEQLSRHASALTQQLLAYAGKGSHTQEPLNLNTLVGEMSDILGLVFSGKAPPRMELSPSLPAVEGDRSQLQQVLMNLLTNAVEALGAEPGTVTVRTRTLPPQDSEQQARVQLEIQDTGCGMSEEVRTRLFDPFFSTKRNGRGLGMSAVLGIIRNHRGTIEVQSQPGQGTRFLIAFPASRLTAPPPSKRVASSLWRGQGTVLLVDDQAILRKTVRMMLKHLGFRVLEAGDGTEALKLFSQHRDELVLVLLDMTMPGLSGLEVARQLHKESPALPVILSSGYNEDAWNSEKDPSLYFLAKPYHLDDLEKSIQAALSPAPLPPQPPA